VRVYSSLYMKELPYEMLGRSRGMWAIVSVDMDLSMSTDTIE